MMWPICSQAYGTLAQMMVIMLMMVEGCAALTSYGTEQAQQWAK